VRINGLVVGFERCRFAIFRHLMLLRDAELAIARPAVNKKFRHPNLTTHNAFSIMLLSISATPFSQ
jgi:hypothetical protein